MAHGARPLAREISALAEICAGRIYSAQAWINWGPHKIIFCGADDKQLDDLSIAVTRKEQEEPED